MKPAADPLKPHPQTLISLMMIWVHGTLRLPHYRKGNLPGVAHIQQPCESADEDDPAIQAPSAGMAATHPDQVGPNLACSIANYLTSGLLVLDTTMKDMLLSLQTSLMTNISAMINNFSGQLQGMGDRVQHIEQKMNACTTTVNELIDAYKDQADDTDWIKAKHADLEDHSRRNNVKIRGVPESVLPADLQTYAGDMIAKLLPDISPIERIIDRIHRIPKPKHLQASLPRDVLMKIHFFPTKERLLAKARTLSALPASYNEIHLYADLSKYTLNMRQPMKTVTKALNNRKIPYKWHHPATILITKNGTTAVINNPQDGLRLLQTWGIFPEATEEGQMDQTSPRLSGTQRTGPRNSRSNHQPSH